MKVIAKIENDKALVEITDTEWAQLQGFRSMYCLKDDKTHGKLMEVGREIDIDEQYRLLQQIKENLILQKVIEIKATAEKIIKFADKIGELR